MQRVFFQSVAHHPLARHSSTMVMKPPRCTQSPRMNVVFIALQAVLWFPCQNFRHAVASQAISADEASDSPFAVTPSQEQAPEAVAGSRRLAVLLGIRCARAEMRRTMTGCKLHQLRVGSVVFAGRCPDTHCMCIQYVNTSYIHTYLHTYIHTCMHACIHAYMHICTHAYMHTCMCACMHTCIHACISIYI